jgi:hypothetical protein
MVGLLRLGALVALFWTASTPGGKTRAPEIDPSAAGAAAALAAGGTLALRNRRSRGGVK